MDHPITPPNEMVAQWRNQAPRAQRAAGASRERWIAIEAARWGDEQRLMACCELVKCSGYPVLALQMLAAMRPKPPSLKQQAMQALDRQVNLADPTRLKPDAMADADTIRRALEALNDE